MHEWNVVVSVYENHYSEARRFLKALGEVSRTDYHNVLALRVADVGGFLEALREAFAREPALGAVVARAIPVTERFTFQSAAEFEAKAKEAAARFLPALSGKRFHVRMHRRGFRETLSSQDEERRLDHFLLESLERSGAPGRITFSDPDAILAVETIGPWAGMSLWKREDLARYPFLRLD